MPQSDQLGLATFNALPDDHAEALLLGCCSSRPWVRAVMAGRPYASADEVYATADAALAELTEADFDEALAGHPRIGQQHGAGHSGSSAREQAGMATAGDAVRAAMVEANREYEARFGHVYLVCATGRTGEELLDILRDRLGNDPVTERRVAREELGKINRIRLERLLSARER
jgi:2-oxo-4-hydroxy-4-carboxy-5-ureidoimidazoline decarboxylase